MTPRISIRLTLHTELGPVGTRIQRGPALPTYQFVFPDTPQGRKEAEAARAELQAYVDKNHQFGKLKGQSS